MSNRMKIKKNKPNTIEETPKEVKKPKSDNKFLAAKNAKAGKNKGFAGSFSKDFSKKKT
jgi:hypothetical protein